MKKLQLLKTQNTPAVLFDSETGKFSLEGRSIPENPGEFFEPMVKWLSEYFENPAPRTELNINLDYVNSGSSKYLLGVFRILKKHYLDGADVVVNWYFEEDDEAIESLGEHYLSILKIPFNMKEYI